jgi:uncharacterized membrane protein YkoI
MSNLLRGQRGILIVLAVIGVVALVAAAAFAAGEGDNDEDENFRGSVVAPQQNGPEGSHDEAAETQSLQKLAKIDQGTAEKAALQAVPGTVKNTKLDEENGFVVYKVEVAGNDGQTHQVDVDAGNGQVLQTEVGEENESGEEGGR